MDQLEKVMTDIRSMVGDTERLEKINASYKERIAQEEGMRMHAEMELESVKKALAQAQSVASGRLAMVYELSAQLGTLGTFATTIAGEVRKIVEKVNTLVPPAAPPETIVGTENLEVELVGPFVGRDPNVDYSSQGGPREGDTDIPFAKPVRERLRDALSSVSVIHKPASLHHNGLKTAVPLSSEQFAQMNADERRRYHKWGKVPTRFRDNK